MNGQQNAPSDDTQPGQYQTTGEKHHVCGICHQSYPTNILSSNYSECHVCKSEGRVRAVRRDKNGKLFKSGELLKKEDSSQMILVMQIQPRHIVTDEEGSILTQEFIDAGWIVHERVTPYSTVNSLCVDQCKFNKPKIGSTYCQLCKQCGGFNSQQQWVICDLYNKENEDDSI